LCVDLLSFCWISSLRRFDCQIFPRTCQIFPRTSQLLPRFPQVLLAAAGLCFSPAFALYSLIFRPATGARTSQSYPNTAGPCSLHQLGFGASWLQCCCVDLGRRFLISLPSCAVNLGVGLFCFWCCVDHYPSGAGSKWFRSNVDFCSGGVGVGADLLPLLRVVRLWCCLPSTLLPGCDADCLCCVRCCGRIYLFVAADLPHS
jgi:hypothetical protein